MEMFHTETIHYCLLWTWTCWEERQFTHAFSLTQPQYVCITGTVIYESAASQPGIVARSTSWFLQSLADGYQAAGGMPCKANGCSVSRATNCAGLLQCVKLS